MRVSRNETDPHRGPLTQGPRSAGEGADSVVRADDVEALRLPLVGAVMGPEGPITWPPTLNRGREGLQSQGLWRVVTDPPVPTRAVAKATWESGDKRSKRLPHRPRVTLRRVSRGGSREVRPTAAGLYGPTGLRLSVTPVEPTSGGAVGTAWRPTYARSGVFEGRPIALTTGRGSSSDRAARARGTSSSPLSCSGASASNARIERDARVSQPGDPEGPRTDRRPTAGSRALRKRGQPTTAERALNRGEVAI